MPTTHRQLQSTIGLITQLHLSAIPYMNAGISQYKTGTSMQGASFSTNCTSNEAMQRDVYSHLIDRFKFQGGKQADSSKDQSYKSKGISVPFSTTHIVDLLHSQPLS